MTTPSPDIKSLIAAGEWLDQARTIVEPSVSWDRWLRAGPAHVTALLASLDALVPVYEAAKRLRAEPDDDFDGQFIEYLVPADDVAALRAALGEPNA